MRPPDATLLVRCDPPTALVYVDDALVGRAADLARRPVGLSAGRHRVELRAEGRLSAYREVTLARGEHPTLDVALRPDLDAADAAAAPAAPPPAPDLPPPPRMGAP